MSDSTLFFVLAFNVMIMCAFFKEANPSFFGEEDLFSKRRVAVNLLSIFVGFLTYFFLDVVAGLCVIALFSILLDLSKKLLSS